MNEIDRLWAGWRAEYVSGAAKPKHDHSCVFCGLLESDRPPNETYIVWQGDHAAALLNAYPYGTGHVLVLPTRHLADIDDLHKEERSAMFGVLDKTIAAIRAVYGPDGLNVGMNLGSAAGAGIPEHLHAHVLPRWEADSNFMTSVANTRVLPESLDVTWQKLHNAWQRD